MGDRLFHMLNKTLKAVVTVSLALGLISLLPSSLITMLLDLKPEFTMLLPLSFTLANLIFLPFPFYYAVKKEYNLMERIKGTVGGKCFISKVSLIDADTGRGMNCFLCFNESKLLVVSKDSGCRELLNLLKTDSSVISFNSDTFDLVIKAVGSKTMRLFTPDPRVRAALSKAGWVVRESTNDNEQ